MIFRDLTTDKNVLAAQVGSQIHELSDTYNGEENVKFLDINTTEGRDMLISRS